MIDGARLESFQLFTARGNGHTPKTGTARPSHVGNRRGRSGVGGPPAVGVGDATMSIGLEPGKERSPLWETSAALGFLGALYLLILLLMRFHANAWVF